MIKIRSKVFTPYDIVLRDDALHRKGNFGHVETWYYDALFDNNYSMVMLVNVFHMAKFGIVLTRLFIYKDKKLAGDLRGRIPYKRFYGSEEEPLIKLNDQQIIRGHIDRSTKTWKYQISMGNYKQGIDLELIKTTKAWKGKTFLGDWLVIPRFKVKGVIFLDGERISVSGEGYHDHNNYPVYAPLVNRGYYFGKIPFDSMNITWAKVMKSRSNKQLLIVLNKDDEYISINNEDICFTVEKQVEDHGKLIPKIWRLNVENAFLNLDVRIESLHFHYISFPSVNYWRHHVRNIGEIKIDSFSKRIDTIGISEYLKFF